MKQLLAKVAEKRVTIKVWSTLFADGTVAQSAGPRVENVGFHAELFDGRF